MGYSVPGRGWGTEWGAGEYEYTIPYRHDF